MGWVCYTFDLMSFSARLLSDLISVESGATVPLSVEVVNKGDAQERFEMQIEGLDPEWTAVPVPIFTIEASESIDEKVFFKAPRVSESLAGNYPFVLTIRSLVSGDQRSLQGVLQVKPFHHLSMELSPKKGHVTPLHKHETFDLTIMNLGNTEHTLQLFGTDPEEGCAFDFEQEQVSIGPGQQKTVDVDLSATSTRVFSSSRLFGFSISARSIETPSVVSSAQAQLEQRPLLTPGTLLFLFLVSVVFGFWFYLIPKPPTLTLNSNKHELIVGQTVELNWQANNANNVWILADKNAVVDAGPSQGSYSLTPTHAGTVHIEGYAQRDTKKSEIQSLDITVGEPAVIPDPHILSFKGPLSAQTGQPFRISFQLDSGVTEAYIAETQQKVDLNASEVELTNNQTGTFIYTLVAKNSAGKVAKKSIKVVVEDASQAVIVSFTGSDSVLPVGGGKVTLNWELTNAKSADIADGRQDIHLDSTMTSMVVEIAKTTTFTLTAYDDKGRPVKKQVKVKIETDLTPPTTTSGTPPGVSGGADPASGVGH